MLRILHGTNYDFIRLWKIAIAATSAFLLMGAAAFIVRPGINESIEFTGGTMLQAEFLRNPPPRIDEIRTALTEGLGHEPGLAEFGTGGREFTIRAQETAQVTAQEAGAENVANQIRRVLTQRFGEGSFVVNSAHAIGPKVGGELRRGAIIAVLISFCITLVYLAWRFEWRFGAAAVIATAHDIIATIAFIKLLNLELSLTVIAGLLTVLGYSLNDTIIIFDRVRENLRKKRKETLYVTLNRSVNETLPRSILTHATTLAATLALLIFGPEVIQPFAAVMTFGIFTGTLSSIYIAGPTLLWIERRWPREVGDRGGVAPRSHRDPGHGGPAVAATPKPVRPTR